MGFNKTAGCFLAAIFILRVCHRACDCTKAVEAVTCQSNTGHRKGILDQVLRATRLGEREGVCTSHEARIVPRTSKPSQQHTVHHTTCGCLFSVVFNSQSIPCMDPVMDGNSDSGESSGNILISSTYVCRVAPTVIPRTGILCLRAYVRSTITITTKLP